MNLLEFLFKIMGHKYVINIIYYFKLYYSMIWPDMFGIFT